MRLAVRAVRIMQSLQLKKWWWHLIHILFNGHQHNHQTTHFPAPSDGPSCRVGRRRLLHILRNKWLHYLGQQRLQCQMLQRMDLGHNQSNLWLCSRLSKIHNGVYIRRRRKRLCDSQPDDIRLWFFTARKRSWSRDLVLWIVQGQW